MVEVELRTKLEMAADKAAAANEAIDSDNRQSC